MKGFKMTQNEQNQQDDESLKFSDLLCCVRAVDSKDRAKFLIDAMNNSLDDVMLAVEKHRKRASIILTLNIEPAKDDEFNTKIYADINVKKPKGEADGTSFYRDPKGKIYNEMSEAHPVVDIRTKK